MYSCYQYNKQLEDDLYREDNSEGSEPDSELEFHLYSQLHYSSNAGEVSEDNGKEVNESTQDDHMSDTGVLGQRSENRSPRLKTNVEQIEKTKKTAKKKEKLRCQKATPMFEEVIVIDSSPDVITLSEEENSDEKEGVCVLKGQRLPKLCTSTPAQEARKKTIDPVHPVNVSSSDSEPESECILDSSSSSESEDLEKWMILGHDEEEGDQSISLNLDMVTESDTDVEEHGGRWFISDKDRVAKISNKDKSVRAVFQRVTNRYYTDKNVHCKNCNKTGHLSKNCPEPKKFPPCFLCSTAGHIPSECLSKHCNNCGLPGHLYSSCSERPYWHKQCHRCSMTGHFFDACPEIWRQYHITTKVGPPVKHQGKDMGRTPAYCYNCSRKGHFGHQCSKPRMFNGTFPSTPFINHYDTKEDIGSRQSRVKHKVQHLKSNGLIPHVPQSPSTSGPPRKKEKISHQYKPHQSFKSDLPASKHIFFGDASAPVPRAKKNRNFQVASREKPWKPKRPVPQSRDSASNAVVVVDDEEGNFPRGGGEGEQVERKKKAKKMKKNGQLLCWTKPGKNVFFSEHAKVSEKKRKRKRAKKNVKNGVDESYPTDENLFIIKQRNHKKN